MRSGSSLSQFLRVFLPILDYKLLVAFEEIIEICQSPESNVKE